MVGEYRTYATCASRWDNFEKFKGPVIANLKDIARSIATDQHLSQDEKKSKLDRLRKCAQDIHEVTLEAAERSAALNQLSASVKSEVENEEPTMRSSSHLRKMFDNGMANAEQRLSAAEQGAREAPPDDLRQLDELVRRATGGGRGGRDDDDDDDVQVDVMASQAPTHMRCPITGRDIVTEAYVNRPCGHYISKEGAILLLVQNADGSAARALGNRATAAQQFTKIEQLPQGLRAKCPTVGCVQDISPSTLKRDYEKEASQRLYNRARREAPMSDVQDLVG